MYLVEILVKYKNIIHSFGCGALIGKTDIKNEYFYTC